MITVGDKSYWPEEEILFFSCANVMFDNKSTIDCSFEDCERFWTRYCGGKKVFIVVDYTGCLIDPKLAEYFATKRVKINQRISITTVRYGGDLALRVALRAMAVKTHVPSNLYMNRDEAVSVVRGIRRGTIQLAEAS
jgi:hypothetical protein